MFGVISADVPTTSYLDSFNKSTGDPATGLKRRQSRWTKLFEDTALSQTSLPLLWNFCAQKDLRFDISFLNLSVHREIFNH